MNNKDNTPFFREALNSLKATRWELFKAKLFGLHSIQTDGYFECEMVSYKGKHYLLSFKEKEPT